jgi:hypothetical protein
MYLRVFIIRVIIFVIALTVLYFGINQLVGQSTTMQQSAKVTPYLYSGITLIFSIISGFIIQSQWHKWNTVIDATRGEANMLRQLYIMAHHFPPKIKNDIRLKIYKYLVILIKESTVNYKWERRAKVVETELIDLEDTIFNAASKHPDTGKIALSYLNRAMEYREQKLQSGVQHMPMGLKIFVIFSTFSVISGPFFFVFSSLLIGYYFTLIIGLMSFGVYLLIDDLDHPYRPSNWNLTVALYRELRNDIKDKIGDLIHKDEH